MKPERWQQLKDLFDKALEKDPAQRTAFIQEACADDASLREEVESLLASHETLEDFLERPACQEAAGLIPAGDDLLGQRLGSYVVTKRIGKGGMGVVYLAEDTRLGRPVAIKALAPQHTGDKERRERLRREARVAATLAHPSIATIYALEEHDDNLYIVCEYVRGRTLLEELSDGPLSLQLLLATGIDVARALAFAHEHGIIHRDLKPENVMRTTDGGIKILDFGLARFETVRSQAITQSTRLTGAGVFLGTPAYASPEQLLGLEVDFRTDVFSFGVTLYELATGSHPFAAADSVATIARILEAEPAGLARLRPIIPPALDQIVRRCLQKSPDRRYGATRELVADLEHVQKSLDEASAPRPQEQIPSAGTAFAPRAKPIWWWQFHQAWVGFMYYALLYPMWKVKEWTPGGLGALFFFLSVAVVGLAANLRFYLWFASISYPAELSHLRESLSRWIRPADILFVFLLLTGAVAIHNEHEVITALLLGVAIGSLGAFLFIEPTTTRAAFGTKS